MKADTTVGIGEILWDVLPEGKVLGGAPANFAYHVSQFGFKSCDVSAVGTDGLGKEIRRVLDEKRMDYVLEDVPFPTGTVQVTLDSGGIPQYEICENVAWDNIIFTDELENLATQTRVVCFGSLAQRNQVSHAAIKRFIAALSTDALKVFDINLRQHFYNKELIEESLRSANILKINDDEILIVAGLFGWEGRSEMEICQLLRQDYALDMVILTKGTKGSYVLSADKTLFRPTPLVQVADTVGAGDSFTAGFVAALLHGCSLEDAHRLAVDISAYVCTCRGAMPVLPDSLKHRL